MRKRFFKISGEGVVFMRCKGDSVRILYFNMRDLGSFPGLEDGDLHVWRFCLEDGRGFPKPEDYLSKDEMEQLERYKLESARECYRIGHTALRMILAGYLCMPADSLEFQVNPYGKLFLPEDYGIYFNISHAGEYVVLAFGRFSPIGIDIEEVYDLSAADVIIKRFFHPREAREYPAVSDSLRQDWFFKRWTVREAYVKGLGTGLYTAPESFYVREEADGSFSIETFDENSCDPYSFKAAGRQTVSAWRIQPLLAPDGYFCSLAFLETIPGQKINPQNSFFI